jgi:hypothetical protein
MRKVVSLLWGAMCNQWDLQTADRHGRTKDANHAIHHSRLLPLCTPTDRRRWPRTATYSPNPPPARLVAIPPALNCGSSNHNKLWPAVKPTRPLASAPPTNVSPNFSNTVNSRKYKAPWTSPSPHPPHNTHRQ